jgi:hypothetical protein
MFTVLRSKEAGCNAVVTGSKQKKCKYSKQCEDMKIVDISGAKRLSM